jgi:hypothetical protein
LITSVDELFISALLADVHLYLFMLLSKRFFIIHHKICLPLPVKNVIKMAMATENKNDSPVIDLGG